jgi:hypothetical protein
MSGDGEPCEPSRERSSTSSESAITIGFRMTRHLDYPAKLLAATLVVALSLAAIGLVVAVTRGGDKAERMTALLIYGGAVLFVVAGLLGGATVSPIRWSMGIDDHVETKQRPITPMVMLVPLGVIGLGLAAHFFL